MKAFFLPLLAYRVSAAVWRPSTPILGFSTWNTFRGAISEDLIKEVAAAINSSGLQALGYRFINLDDEWGNYTRNSSGCIIGDTTRFSSGMANLGTWLHENGFLFGLYTSRATRTCTGNMPGSLGKEELDALTFSEYGADFIKNDDCGVVYADAAQDYGTMQSAIASVTDRPMYHNVKAPDLPPQPAVNVSQFRRVGHDLKNSWQNVMRVLDQGTDLSFSRVAGPENGFFNDFDMLEVGTQDDSTGDSALTVTEQQSHFTLWSALKSPLVLGNDPRTMTNATLRILSNSEVISVNQDQLGIQAVRISSTRPSDLSPENSTTKLRLDPCNDGEDQSTVAPQSWTINGSRIRSTDYPGLCLTVYNCRSHWPFWTTAEPCADEEYGDENEAREGGDQNKNNACSVSDSQSWSVSNGTIRWSPSSLTPSCWGSPGEGCCLSSEGANPELESCGWAINQSQQEWTFSSGRIVSSWTGQCLSFAGDLEVFAAPLSGGRATAILLNRASLARNMSVSFQDIVDTFGEDLFPFAGNGQGVAVRDLWAHQDLGMFTGGEFEVLVDSHVAVHVNLAP